MSGRSHFIAGGSPQGTVVLWDLRGATREKDVFEGQWQAPVFSSDFLVIKDDEESGQLDIVSIACSDAPDPLFFALDILGTVSVWRVVESTAGQAESDKAR